MTQQSRGRTAAHDPDALFRTDHLAAGGGRRIGMAATLVLAFAAVKFLAQIGFTAILARQIPPGEQGLVAMAMPVMALSVALSQFGLAQALIQRPEVSHDFASALFWMNAGLGVIFALVLAALGWPAAWFYAEPRITAIFVALAFSVLFSALLAQYVAVLRRTLRIREIETSGMVALLGSFGAAVVMAEMGAGYWALVAQQVLLPLINLVQLALSLRWRPAAPSRVDFRAVRGALAFGGHATIAGLVTQVAHSAGTVVAGQMFSVSMAGAYYRSWNLTNLPQRQVLGALGGAFMPGLARVQHDPPAFAALFRRIVSRADLLMMPIAILLITASDLIVRVLLGPDWGLAVPFMAWLGVMIAHAAVQNACTWALLAQGKAKPMMINSFFAAAMIMVALIAGAQYGPQAMVASYVISGLVIRQPIFFALTARVTTLDLATIYRDFLVDLVFAALVALAVWFGRGLVDALPALAELALIGIAVALAYGARIALDPGLRGDVGKILGRIAARRGKPA